MDPLSVLSHYNMSFMKAKAGERFWEQYCIYKNTN